MGNTMPMLMMARMTVAKVVDWFRDRFPGKRIVNLSAQFVKVHKGTTDIGTNQARVPCLTLWANIYGSSDPGKQACRWKITGQAEEFPVHVAALFDEQDIEWNARQLRNLTSKVPLNWREFPEGTEWAA